MTPESDFQKRDPIRIFQWRDFGMLGAVAVFLTVLYFAISHDRWDALREHRSPPLRIETAPVKIENDKIERFREYKTDGMMIAKKPLSNDRSTILDARELRASVNGTGIIAGRDNVVIHGSEYRQVGGSVLEIPDKKPVVTNTKEE